MTDIFKQLIDSIVYFNVSISIIHFIEELSLQLCRINKKSKIHCSRICSLEIGIPNSRLRAIRKDLIKAGKNYFKKEIGYLSKMKPR